jgi:hypothetical protein
LLDNFNDTFPYPSPIPAPGPSLLDDRESQFLDSFFDGVSNDQPFDFNSYTYAPDGSDIGMGWDELPPMFMGTQTSFGQQPQVPSEPAMQHSMPDMISNALITTWPPPPPPPSNPATSRSLGSNSFLENPNVRQRSLDNEVLFRGPDMSVATTNGQSRQQSMSQYISPRSNTETQEEIEFKDTFYTDMVLGTQPGTFRPRQVSQNHMKADLRWGSDSAFGGAERFIPQVSEMREIAAVEHSQTKALAEAFIETNSPDATRPSSPNQTRTIISHQRTKSIGQSYEDDDHDSRSYKRRKHDDDGDESPGSGTYKNSNKRRRPSKKDSPMESPEHHKRRKSNAAAAAAKATRENLTEDQKRENHIKSEQKRRTLIREGFEDLGELVPGLRGGGFSKSAVLIMAADWLEELMHGNDILRQRLELMQ